MAINTDPIDQLLKDYQKPGDVLGESSLLKRLTKAALERAMQAELTHHPGYEKHDPADKQTGDSRNGKSKKTPKGDFGTLPIEVPRDRNSSFEPQVVPKGQTRFEGFGDKILSLYARGLTARQIKQHLEEISLLLRVCPSEPLAAAIASRAAGFRPAIAHAVTFALVVEARKLVSRRWRRDLVLSCKS
jgi:transposase-like protein